MKQTFPLIIALAATSAFAQETRQMDAHEHGTGRLNIAAEGDTVAMELHAPGADIVGFEYAPESDTDQAKLALAVEALEAPLDLFVLPDAAGCSVTETHASLELEGEDAHESHDDHGHDDHDDHAEKAGHSEFHAEYSLNCDNPSALNGIEFAYFAQFENALELEVQVVTASGAQALRVTRDAPQLALEGLF